MLGADEVYRIKKAREDNYDGCHGCCLRHPDTLCTKIKMLGKDMGIPVRKSFRRHLLRQRHTTLCPCSLFTKTELDAITNKMLDGYYGSK